MAEKPCYVGKQLPIFLIPHHQPTNGIFEIIAISEDGERCDVRWPNGHIDQNISTEEMTGQISFIDAEDYSLYFGVLESE